MVDVVEVQEREDAGVRAAGARMTPDVGTQQLLGEQARRACASVSASIMRRKSGESRSHVSVGSTL